LASDQLHLGIADIFSRVPPDRDALIHDGERWSFGELQAEATRFAAGMASRGVGHGDFVAFALPNGPQFFALAFGIYMCGAIPAPLSAMLASGERDAILDLLKPAIFVSDETLEDMVSCKSPLPSGQVSPSWKACTSGGSTGRPKVIVDARPAAFPATTEFVDIPANGRVIIPGPLYHNAPFACAIFALWRGSCVVTLPKFDALETLRLIEAERVEWALMVPTMMGRILALPGKERNQFDLTTWSKVVHTAAPMPEWQKRAWIEWMQPEHIWEVYGSTEGIIRCFIGGQEWLERPGSVGRPIGGVELRVLGDAGQDLPPGATGEIYALPPGGGGSTYRYIGADSKRIDGGWESVGDAGWIDADGYLFLADRIDDLIISGGVNVWPAEVEAALLRHPRIRSCAVYGKRDEDMGTIVHAVVETDEGLSLDDVRAFLGDHLARPKHPRSLEVQDTPVRDDAGKFRKPKLGRTRT